MADNKNKTDKIFKKLIEQKFLNYLFVSLNADFKLQSILY